MEDLCMLNEWKEEAIHNNKMNQRQTNVELCFEEGQYVMWYLNKVKIRPGKI
jgi:hypothetical protein